MAEVRWTPQAANDLEAIADFISENSTHYASLFVIDVLNSVKRLENFPRSGRIGPESNDPIIREIILKNLPVNLHPCWKGKAVFPMIEKGSTDVLGL